MDSRRAVLGWAMTMRPLSDETGVSHLLIDKGNGVAVPACGTRAYSFGGIETRDASKARRPCRKCAASPQ